MTTTEQMVWSAAFVAALNETDYRTRHTRMMQVEARLGFASGRAYQAVESLRDARNIFERNDKDSKAEFRLIPDELNLLREMTNEQEV